MSQVVGHNIEIMNDKERNVFSLRIDGKKIEYVKAIQYTDTDMERLVIGVDLAVTNNDESDETGILVVGKKGEHFYVFRDNSMKASPLMKK